MSGHAYAGTALLVRHVLRRDRWRLAAWWLVLAVIPWSTANRYDALYPTAQSRELLAATAAASPSFTLLLGPAYHLTDAGGFVAWRVGLWEALLLAIPAALTVVRHTRAEEDAGRADLVASGAVGRRAPLLAALVVALALCLATGLAAGGLLAAAGLGAAGSWLFAAGVASTGAVFAGVAAVAAQLASYARSAHGIALGVLGAAFAVRGYGDAAGHGWVSWLSPLGWHTQLRPYAGDRWWVLALPVAATLLAWVLASRLAARRDVGAGLLPVRPGPAAAPASLAGVLGLAWRLQRGLLLGWAVGLGLGGLMLGSLASALEGFVTDNAATRRVLESMGGTGDLVLTYLALVLPILGSAAVLYGVASVGRARAEEADGRLEALLATAMPRLRWLGAQLAVAFGGVVVLMLAAGLGVAATAVPSLPPGTVRTGQILGAALLQVPAVWVLVALGVAVLGLLPRATALVWAAASAVLLLTWLGPALGASDAVLAFSPFEHLPKVPGHAVTIGPVVALLGVSAALLAAGTLAFRRRDLQT